MRGDKVSVLYPSQHPEALAELGERWTQAAAVAVVPLKNLATPSLQAFMLLASPQNEKAFASSVQLLLTALSLPLIEFLLRSEHSEALSARPIA